MANHNQIEDISLARRMADKEAPIRELAFQAKALGLVAIASDIELAANHASSEIASSKVSDMTEAEASSETQKEKLLELLHRSGVVASVWAHGYEIPRKYGSSGGSGFQALHSPNLNNEDARSLATTKTPENILGEIRARGVAEVVTFTTLDKPSKFSRGIPGHTSELGPVTIVTYETTVSKGHQGTRYQQGTTSVPNPETRYHYFMEPSDAKTLQELIANDPDVVHSLADATMQDIFEVPPKHHQALGPRYEEWRELDGGVSRIAMRSNLNTPAEQSRIIEF